MNPLLRKNINTTTKYRVNDEITARTVQLIDDKSVALGEVPLHKALEIASERGFDLVEIGANQNPPVCRLLDYGKFRYQSNKKQHGTKKKQKSMTTKELKFRPRIDVHDFGLRIKRAEEFLNDGYKVKFTLQIRGREVGLSQRSDELFNEIITKLGEISEIESTPGNEKTNNALVLVPKKKLVK